jgi:hypothetical protein
MKSLMNTHGTIYRGLEVTLGEIEQLAEAARKEPLARPGEATKRLQNYSVLRTNRSLMLSGDVDAQEKIRKILEEYNPYGGKR